MVTTSFGLLPGNLFRDLPRAAFSFPFLPITSNVAITAMIMMTMMVPRMQGRLLADLFMAGALSVTVMLWTEALDHDPLLSITLNEIV